MRKNDRTAVAVLLLLAVACATVGPGDPVVVKTEDYLTNSLTFYDAAMRVHEQFSRTESLTTYRSIEAAKPLFETAWRALSDGLARYKVDRDKGQLAGLIGGVAEILKRLAQLIPVGSPVPTIPAL